LDFFFGFVVDLDLFFTPFLAIFVAPFVAVLAGLVDPLGAALATFEATLDSFKFVEPFEFVEPFKFVEPFVLTF